MFVRLSKFVGKIFIFLAAMPIVLVGFFGFSRQVSAVGLTVGTDTLQLGSSDNLFSGTISTTGPAGNFLLLRQGANDMFSINNAGNFWSNGILTFASNTLNTIDVACGQIIGLGYVPVTSTAAVSKKYLHDNFAPIGPGVGSAFVLGGNSFATTSLLGTNDNNHLIFETNNTARMTVYNNGNIGIGTTVPGSKLDLNGNISTAKIFTIDSSAVADRAQLGFGIYPNYSLIQSYGLGTSAGSLAINPLGNNVGIGLTNPSAKLSVNGGIKASRLGYFGTYDSTLVQGIWSIAENYAINTNTNTFGSQYGIVYAHTNASSTGLTNGPIAGWGHQILFVNNGIYKAGVSLENGNAYFNGSVGIGTTIPAFKLGVAGSIHLRGLNAVLEMGNGNTASTYGSIGFNNSTNDVELKQKYNSGGIRFFTNTSSERLSIISSGNIGIASTTPIAKLGIASSTAVVINVGGGSIGGLDLTPINNDQAVPLGYLKANYNASTTSFWGGSLTGDIYNSNTGNVGIGTTTPGTKAEVYRLETVNRQSYSDILTVSAAANNNPWMGHGGGILFRATNYDSGTGLVNSARIGSTITNHSSAHTGANLFFDVSPLDDGVLSRAMTILPGGNIGIGTTNPSEKLTIGSSVNSQILGLNFYGKNASSADAQGSISMNPDNQAINIQWGGTSVTPMLTVKHPGNIGIGTTNPAQKLDVQGSIAIANNMLGGGKSYGNSGNSASAYLQMYNGSSGNTILNNQNYALDFQTATTSRLFIKNDGNIGISTTTATTKLYISGGTGDVINVNGGSIAGLNSTPINNDQAVPLGYLKANYNASTTSFWGGSLTGDIYNSNTGNVGIGTTTPAEKLQIKSGSILLDNNYSIKFRNVAGTSVANIGTNPGNGLSFDAIDGASMSFKTGSGFHADRILIDASGNIAFNTSQLYLNSAGNIGVGTTSPETKLHVNGIIKSGQIGTSGGIYLARSSDGTSQVSLVSSSTNEFRINQSGGLNSKFIMGASGIEFQTENSTSPYDKITRMIIKHGDSGNVGIGTIVPSQKLVVSSIDTAPLLNAATATNTALMLSNSDTGYGTFFGTLGSGTGLIQQRRQASAVYYDLALNPYGGNIGIASTSPIAKLGIASSTAVVINVGGGKIGGLDLTPINNDEAVPLAYLTSNYKSLWGGTKNGNIWNGDAGVGNVGIGTTAPLAKLHVNGGMVLNRTAVTATTYTATTTDYIIAFTSLTANATLTLPSDLCDSGRVFLIVNETNTAYKVFITPQSGTIIGNPSLTLNAYNSTPVYCNGNKTTPAWFIY